MPWCLGALGVLFVCLLIQALNYAHVISHSLSAPANNFWTANILESTATTPIPPPRMAASEPSRYLARSLPRAFAPSARPQTLCLRRNASDNAASKPSSDHISELEPASSLATPVPEDVVKSFNPVARAKARKTQLPKSR